MRDEPYEAGQLPAYGSDHQPALQARVTAPLHFSLAGTVVAAVAVVAAVIAWLRYPVWSGGDAWWVGGLIGATLVLLVCCGAQHAAWRTASRSWSERPGVARLAALSRRSWVVHVVAYAATALVWVCGALGLLDAGGSTAGIALVVALVCAATALVLAGVQYVRASGAPGTTPAHMRRLVARNRP